LIVALCLLHHAAHADSAEDLYTQGQGAYDSGDFKTAVARWQAAYDLSKESGLLFNLAQAQRLSGDCAGALATYERFIVADTDPTSEQHKLAVDFLHELEGTCPAKPPTIATTSLITHPVNTKPPIKTPFDEGRNAAPPRDRVEAPPAGRSWRIAGLVTGGVGVAALAAGLGFGHHGATIGNEITTACRTSCDWASLKDKDARGARDVTIGNALDVVGVAAIVGGAAFYYLGVRRDNEALAITPTGNGAVVSWNGSW
jgi:tetratricopeptide (TPR) repeat protein